MTDGSGRDLGQGWCGAAAQSVLTTSTPYQNIERGVWDLRKVGRAKDYEWVTSSRARLGLGSQVCRAAQSRCGANGDGTTVRFPGP